MALVQHMNYIRDLIEQIVESIEHWIIHFVIRPNDNIRTIFLYRLVGFFNNRSKYRMEDIPMTLKLFGCIDKSAWYYL